MFPNVFQGCSLVYSHLSNGLPSRAAFGCDIGGLTLNFTHLLHVDVLHGENTCNCWALMFGVFWGGGGRRVSYPV